MAKTRKTAAATKAETAAKDAAAEQDAKAAAEQEAAKAAAEQEAKAAAEDAAAKAAAEMEAAKAVVGEVAAKIAASIKDAFGPTIIVRGPRQGRWRAGRHFGRDPVEIPLEELSEKEQQALIGDPVLSVTTVPIEQE